MDDPTIAGLPNEKLEEGFLWGAGLGEVSGKAH
jgi:hypothetical protein